MEKPPLEIEALAETGPFQVTLEGEAQDSPFTHKSCIYYEWTFGVKEPVGWTITWQGHRSRCPIKVTTPYGAFELRVYQVRLYIAPAYSRIYSINEAEKAPEAMRKRILLENKALTAEEYRLEAGHTYHARVEMDNYSLPYLASEDTPSLGRTAILAISDLPFIRGKPQRPMTPYCLNFTF